MSENDMSDTPDERMAGPFDNGLDSADSADVWAQWDAADAYDSSVAPEKEFPPEFLNKPIENVVLLVCHGGCDAFDKPRKETEPKPKFKTKFDTIFTSELGLPTYAGNSYQLGEALLRHDIKTGRDVVSSLAEITRSLPDLLGQPTRLNLKQRDQHVTDMHIFTAGDYDDKTIDDGIFLFKLGRSLAPRQVEATNIAPILFRRAEPFPKKTPKGYSTITPSYFHGDDRSVKLSDVLKTNGALDAYGLTPENTVVLVVSCRVIVGVRQPDWVKVQSPTTSADSMSSRSSSDDPFAWFLGDIPSDSEGHSSAGSRRPHTKSKSKRKSKSKSKSKRQSKSQRKSKSKSQRKSKSKSKSKSKRKS